MFNGDTILIWETGKVLEMGDEDGCTSMNVLRGAQ